MSNPVSSRRSIVWLCCSTSLLFNGYRVSFSQVKELEHKGNKPTPFVLRLRISGAVSLLPLRGMDMVTFTLHNLFNFIAHIGAGKDIRPVKLGRSLLLTYLLHGAEPFLRS